MSDGATGAAAPRGFAAARVQATVGRYLGRGILGLIVALVLAWAGYKASGNVPTFIIVGLNGITLGGLFFVVASGFTLIFGLMRVVNMAHGSFYLLGGYIAFNVQDEIGNFGVPLLVACASVALIGLLMQQLFLRWNQGQDLRQALITIAISIILADQMLAHFGGLAKGIDWPKTLDRASPLHFYNLSYPFVRIFILLCAIAIGVGLWVWLTKTRTGMIIRAGVDDRQMVSALGINIQVVFAITFAIGSALAAFGGVLGGSLISLGPGEDTNFLLNSLIAVIIGGMGSLVGAAIGALLFGVVDSYADVYLPIEWSNYSVLLTLTLLVLVLAVRPLGLFGRPA